MDAGFHAFFANSVTSGDPGVVSQAMHAGFTDIRRVSKVRESFPIVKRGASSDVAGIDQYNFDFVVTNKAVIIIDTVAVQQGSNLHGSAMSRSGTPGLANENEIAQITRDLSGR